MRLRDGKIELVCSSEESGSFQSDGQVVGSLILDGHVVRDYKFIQMAERLRSDLRFGIEPCAFAEIVHVSVSKNSALRTEKKGVERAQRNEAVYIVTAHGVQEPGTVFAGELKFAAGGEIQISGARAQSFEGGHAYSPLCESERR